MATLLYRKKFLTMSTVQKRYINNLDAKEFRIPTTKEEYEKMVDVLRRDWGKVKGSPQRLAIMLGMLSKEGRAEIPSDEKSQFSMESYKYLLESPFLMSSECCAVMKKKPAHLYYKEAKKKPIIATMAEESSLRTRKWLQNGCNGFDLEIPTSTPLSFWTEQDILQYIKTKELPICSVYGDIVYTDDDGMEYTEQLFMEAMPLKTTGCNRTGCMFCGYGCHLEKEGEGRFERMKHTHPQIYEWIMKPWSDGGLDYKNVIDWLNENGGLNIKY